MGSAPPGRNRGAKRDITEEKDRRVEQIRRTEKKPVMQQTKNPHFDEVEKTAGAEF